MTSTERFNQMMEDDSQIMAFQVNRHISAQINDGLDQGPSAEALDELNLGIMQWIGSRMMRYYEATGLVPQNIEVIVSVAVEA